MKQIPVYGREQPTVGDMEDDITIGRMIGFIRRPTKPVVGYRTVEYGPHMPTLCELLEAGYFEDAAGIDPSNSDLRE